LGFIITVFTFAFAFAFACTLVRWVIIEEKDKMLVFDEKHSRPGHAVKSIKWED
jgi:hypothetical protein